MWAARKGALGLRERARYVAQRRRDQEEGGACRNAEIDEKKSDLAIEGKAWGYLQDLQATL